MAKTWTNKSKITLHEPLVGTKAFCGPNALFPLNPTLSLGERENPLGRFMVAMRAGDTVPLHERLIGAVIRQGSLKFDLVQDCTAFSVTSRRGRYQALAQVQNGTIVRHALVGPDTSLSPLIPAPNAHILPGPGDLSSTNHARPNLQS